MIKIEEFFLTPILCPVPALIFPDFTSPVLYFSSLSPAPALPLPSLLNEKKLFFFKRWGEP
jgi:hypothetical protein